METDKAYREKLQSLALEARDHRGQEEKALCGHGDHEDLIAWARDWRKVFEAYALACDLEIDDQACALA